MIVLLLKIFLQGCSSPEKVLDKARVENEECRELLLTLQKKVYPLEDNEFYGFRFESEKLSEQADEYMKLADRVYHGLSRERLCIKGLTKANIVQLFGKLPKYNNKIHDTYIYYVKIGKNCPGDNTDPNSGRYGQCDLLRFIFSIDGYLQEVNFLASTVGWYNGYD